MSSGKHPRTRHNRAWKLETGNRAYSRWRHFSLHLCTSASLHIASPHPFPRVDRPSTGFVFLFQPPQSWTSRHHHCYHRYQIAPPAVPPSPRFFDLLPFFCSPTQPTKPLVDIDSTTHHAPSFTRFSWSSHASLSAAGRALPSRERETEDKATPGCASSCSLGLTPVTNHTPPA